MLEGGFDVGDTVQAWAETMIELAKKPCSECGGRLRLRKIAQEFEREGVRVRLAGIQAGSAVDAARCIFCRAVRIDWQKQLGPSSNWRWQAASTGESSRLAFRSHSNPGNLLPVSG
jgi:hypothetical protein